MVFSEKKKMMSQNLIEKNQLTMKYTKINNLTLQNSVRILIVLLNLENCLHIYVQGRN